MGRKREQERKQTPFRHKAETPAQCVSISALTLPHTGKKGSKKKTRYTIAAISGIFTSLHEKILNLIN